MYYPIVAFVGLLVNKTVCLRLRKKFLRTALQTSHAFRPSREYVKQPTDIGFKKRTSMKVMLG